MKIKLFKFFAVFCTAVTFENFYAFITILILMFGVIIETAAAICFINFDFEYLANT